MFLVGVGVGEVRSIVFVEGVDGTVRWVCDGFVCEIRLAAARGLCKWTAYWEVVEAWRGVDVEAVRRLSGVHGDTSLAKLEVVRELPGG